MVGSVSIFARQVKNLNYIKICVINRAGFMLKSHQEDVSDTILYQNDFVTQTKCLRLFLYLSFHSQLLFMNRYSLLFVPYQLTYNKVSPLVTSPVMEVPSDSPFSEDQARHYFRDIVLGIEYCESFPLFLKAFFKLLGRPHCVPFSVYKETNLTWFQ